MVEEFNLYCLPGRDDVAVAKIGGASWAIYALDGADDEDNLHMVGPYEGDPHALERFATNDGKPASATLLWQPWTLLPVRHVRATLLRRMYRDDKPEGTTTYNAVLSLDGESALTLWLPVATRVPEPEIAATIAAQLGEPRLFVTSFGPTTVVLPASGDEETLRAVAARLDALGVPFYRRTPEDVAQAAAFWIRVKRDYDRKLRDGTYQP